MVTIDWLPPSEFDDYLLMQPLGRGGLGHVYVAYDTLLARHVAIKFVAELEPSAEVRQRFLVEARAAARLQHPNVVSVYRVGELDQQPYIVSEFVRGETLDRIERPVPWTRALEIGIDLARGLAAAHRKGVLHCDIKPANAILTDEGTAKLLDFGLARLAEGPSESAGAAAVPGVAMGTPHYAAPEIWGGEPATARSDVYSLGVVLYELCAGEPPHAEVAEEELPRAVQSIDAPPLQRAAPGVDARFAAIVDRCLSREPAGRYGSGDELREALEDLARAASGATIPEGNPYRGLRPFEAEHRALFFGRGAEIGVILDRLRAERCVVVAGDSGAGKSSLCRAGILPRVAEGGLGPGRAWTTVAIVPGRDPVGAIAAGVAELTGASDEELAQRLRADPAEIGRWLRRHFAANAGVVVFVDQLEEIVTLADPAEERLVEDLLMRLAAGPPNVRLLATLRADFLTRVASLPTLGQEISRGLYVLRPLSEEGIREAIVGPARATGIAFESEALVETLVETTASAQGGLPLLQFALAELWEARDRERGLITASALESLGGVAGALARHADAVLDALVPDRRAAARRLLMRLVTAGGTRARRTEAELTGGDAVAGAALDALVRGRLVVAHHAEDGSAGYELAHEVLIQGWPTLRRWLLEDEEGRIVRERLVQAAGEWERLGRTRDALWSARQLAEAGRIERTDLNPREAEFLHRSKRAVRRVRWGRRAIVVGAPLLVALSYGVVELKARFDLRERVDAHMGDAKAALTGARAKDAQAGELRKEAFGYFDKGELARGEEVWARVLSTEAEAERGYVAAGQALEAALAQDSGRADVRALFGDVLYERALIAERTRQTRVREELVQRMALYDEGGERVRRWNAPAAIAVESEPAGAAVAVHRYVEKGGKLVLEPVREVGRTPIAEFELLQGSYLLMFELAGRFPVRYPVLLAREEHLRVRVPLPRTSEIPKGFVYVPPGRFLFGSAADEEVRRGFFETVPLHETWTAGYLISRREVTFGEWIEFLQTLGSREQAARTPRVASQGPGAVGALRLERQGATWRLTLQPSHTAFVAVAGEHLMYPGRKRRARQDWLRFPVTAISALDAEEYASWFNRTHRVPSARLCTEMEWERAARGADSRIFPHGDQLRPDEANYAETYGKDPLAMGLDEVGSHPSSRSPFDLDDMSGNAWEWASSSLQTGRYVVRGGAYFYDRKTNQVINRQVPVAAVRDGTVGFRLCGGAPK